MINKSTYRDAYKLMHYGMLAFARAERQGFRVDLDQARASQKKLTKSIHKLETKFKDSKFFKDWEKSQGYRRVNTNSPDQLATYLYKVKGLKPQRKTKSGKGSTDEATLEALNIKELNYLLEIRKIQKIRDTYLESFIREAVDGYIHPFYNLHTTVTYRSSSDSPNFQNIPIRTKRAKEVIRGCLYPRPGHQLLEIDYSNIEVRVSTCYHKDPTMIKYIEDPSTNMHTDTAKEIYFINKLKPEKISGHNTLRQSAKNSFVFPQFYGDYYANNAKGLSKWIKLPTNKRWKDTDGIELQDNYFIGEQLRKNKITSYTKFESHLKRIESDFWNERFPVYRDWKERWWHDYQKKGYFDMYTGFRCSGVMEKNNAINYPVQGSAFHCLLWSFIEADRQMQKQKWDTKLIGQIHDSIIFDVHPDEMEMVLQTVKKITCVDLPREWKWIIVPMVVDAEACEVDQSWLYKDKIAI